MDALKHVPRFQNLDDCQGIFLRIFLFYRIPLGNCLSTDQKKLNKMHSIDLTEFFNNCYSLITNMTEMNKSFAFLK